MKFLFSIWVSFSQAEPRIFFSSSLIRDQLNFSEAFVYDLKKLGARGLAGPNNQTKRQGFNSFSSP